MFAQFEKYKQARQLVKELPTELRDALIYDLLCSKDIDYTKISKLYVQSLEAEREDKKALINEAGCCIMEQLMDQRYTPKGRKKKELTLTADQRKHALRSLYFLNQTRQFNMETTNELFDYNEEEAKKLSWYEREKESNKYG
jgi:hypothetical protein